MNFWRISKRPSGIQGTRFPSFFLRQNSEKYLKSGKKIPQVQSEKYYTLLWKFGKYLWDVNKERKSPHFIFVGKLGKILNIHQTLSSKIRKILTGIIPWSGHFSFVFYVGYCQKGVSVSCQYLCLLVGQVITLIRCLKCLKSIRLVSLSQFSSKLLFKALFVLFVMFQTSRQSLEYKGISWNFWQTLCLDWESAE